jgi:hypothetical protein
MEGGSPPVEGGMAGFHRDERPGAGGANFPVGGKCPLHPGAVGRGLDDAGLEGEVGVHGSGREQLDGVAGGDGAGRLGEGIALHEVPRGGPIAVAVEQGADDAAVENPGKCRVVRAWFPGRKERAVGPGKTADMQTLGVGGTAAEADACWRIAFLQAGVGARHGQAERWVFTVNLVRVFGSRST